MNDLTIGWGVGMFAVLLWIGVSLERLVMIQAARLNKPNPTEGFVDEFLPLIKRQVENFEKPAKPFVMIHREEGPERPGHN